MWQFFRRDTFTLHKEITIVVIVKLIAIFILWYFCFSHPVKDHLTTRVMQQHMSGKHDGPAFLRALLRFN